MAVVIVGFRGLPKSELTLSYLFLAGEGERTFEDTICGALRDLVLFVQFKKRKKHPWRSVNFSKVAGFSLKLY